MSELNDNTPTEQPVEEKKKNKKPLIIGGILGGVAVIAIGAIILSTTGNGGVIPTPNPTPTQKPYITAIINGKEYKDAKTVSIVDGVEVSDITKLASLTDANKEAYSCLPVAIGQTNPDGTNFWTDMSPKNLAPALFWSNIADVPVEYQTIDIIGKVSIALPKTNTITLESGWNIEYNSYGYACSIVGGLKNPVDETISKTITGVYNPETEQMEKQPLPEKYNNWYGNAQVAAGATSRLDANQLTTYLPYSKWVQMKRMSPISENQSEYVKGFTNGNSANIYVNNMILTNPAEATDTQIQAALDENLSQVSKLAYWANLSPESQQAYQDGFMAFFAFAKAPTDAVIPALPKPIVVEQVAVPAQGENLDPNAPILIEDVAVPSN